MDTNQFKGFIAETIEAQDEVAECEWQDDELYVRLHEGNQEFRVLTTSVPSEVPAARSDDDPIDIRALILWETVNCWYHDVSVALRVCAQMMKRSNAPLTEQELFELAADLRHDQLMGKTNATPMDGTWWETVKIAHESLLTLNGDLGGDKFIETFHELDRLGHGPVGTYEETARLMIFATGPVPARRFSDVK